MKSENFFPVDFYGIISKMLKSKNRHFSCVYIWCRFFIVFISGAASHIMQSRLLIGCRQKNIEPISWINITISAESLIWPAPRDSVIGLIILLLMHGDVMTWECLPLYWPFVRGIHQSLVDAPHITYLHHTLKFVWYSSIRYHWNVMMYVPRICVVDFIDIVYIFSILYT